MGFDSDGCREILDIVHGREEPSLFGRMRVGAHLLACPECAEKVERFGLCVKTMTEGFLPDSPGLEEGVMAAIAEEEGAFDGTEVSVPGGFSLGGWVVAGIVLLVSTATIFFGVEFRNVALASGMSFMIPVGITVGIALTVYGAIFIGSHLKKLSERFGLESRHEAG